MKYIRITNNILTGGLLLALFLLNACSEDALKYDVTGDTMNRVYVNTGTSYVNNYSIPIVQTPISSIGTVAIAFPARSTQAAPTDIKVTFAVDNSLVSTYNEAHTTGYLPVPDNLLFQEYNVVTIHKGDACSSLLFNLSISNQNLSYLTDPGYVIPIKIASISDTENTAVSSNLSIVYVVITTSRTNCYNSPVIGDMVGTLITPRTTWSATLDVALVSGTLPQMFDGSTSTYWRINPAVFNLNVDLKTAYTTITGIRTNSNSTNYGLRQVNVFTSNDGITWINQGSPTLSTSSTYQYIKFYSPVAARYLKIQPVTFRSTSRMYMAEFDVYKN